MNKQEYQKPEVEIVVFETDDVITTSNIIESNGMTLTNRQL